MDPVIQQLYLPQYVLYMNVPLLKNESRFLTPTCFRGENDTKLIKTGPHNIDITLRPFFSNFYVN